MLHATAELDTVVGDACVIGHIVHLEGCVIEDGSLVGNGSVVLHRAVVRSGALVGSNAVVPNGMEVPSATMALGVPAKIREVDPGSFEDTGARLRRARASLPRPAAPPRLN
ncbi:MAG: hypothetical protein U5R31_02530 [Acidimicrobiia bacterium]|nr:hypothetical protein [Acidimicrobiia bacterium]